MTKKVEPDTFRPQCHKLRKDIETRLAELLNEYQSQFTHDETTIGTTPLTEMMIDIGISEPVSQKPYQIAMKHYKSVKDKINKLLTAKVIWGSWSIWSTPIIVVLKGDGGKCLVIDYCALNKITQKCIWPMPKVEDIFAQLNGVKYFSTLDLWVGITTSHWMSHQYPKQPSCHHLENINMSRYSSDSHKHMIFPGTHNRCPKELPFCYCLLRWYNHLQQDGRGTPRPHQAG